MSLDDLEDLARLDPGDMLGASGRLAEHVEQGYAAGRTTADLPDADGVTAIALCGMGGSAMGGDVARALFASRLGVPIEVVRGPVLPEYCETHTLVVCTSYSGNTAETIAAFEEAVRRGSRVVAVTSGGAMGSRARELGVPVVPVQAGFQPRAALGLLALGLLGALESMGVVPSLAADVDEATQVVRRLAEELGPASPGNRAMALARRMNGRIPVVWGADGAGAVAATRWKTQLNENAKVPAWWSQMSELDHNEIAAWTDGSAEGYFLVALRHDGEGPGIAPRFPLSLAIARDAGIEAEEVRAEGRSPLARVLSLITVGDHVSVYLALVRGVDPTPVDAIERLKRELG